MDDSTPIKTTEPAELPQTFGPRGQLGKLKDFRAALNALIRRKQIKRTDPFFHKPRWKPQPRTT